MDGKMAYTVLITGSNRGIGRGLVKHYLAQGYEVIACCRKPDKAASLHSLASTHPNLRILPLDITNQKQIDDLAKQLSGIKIDIVINNAADMGGPNALIDINTSI